MLTNFLTLKPKAFGLDISDLSLKIVSFEKKRDKLKLSSFGEKEIEPGIIIGGLVVKESELAENIVKAVEGVSGKKLKTKYVIASLPEEKAFFQVIQVPLMEKEDLKSAIIYEAENYIPMPIEKVYLDFQIIPSKENSKHLNVLISAIPKNTVDSYLTSLKLAGLKPVALEVESLAIARSLIKDELTTEPTLIIDLGATRTSFIIYSNHSLRFTSSIKVSSADFTKIISKNLGIETAEAEKLKIKYGLEKGVRLKNGDSVNMETKKETNAGRKRSEIFEALIPVLVDLTQQIKKHLRYYQSHTSRAQVGSKEEGVSKILLCGGGSSLKGLPELLSQELKLPVELGNPWTNVSLKENKSKPKLSLENSLRYTTAIGLGIRGTMKNNG